MPVIDRSDVQALAQLLREVAVAEIMPRFRRLEAGDIRAKTGPLDLVTAADEAAERAITAGLRQRFPGCLVVGEEATAANPALLAGLPTADLAFVVDPVDGTSNFAAGLPLFATMAAAIVQGEVVAAAIHDPLSGSCAIALRGMGAWMEESDGRQHDLRVAAPVAVPRMAGSASWRYLPEPLKSRVCANLPKLAACWDYRCAGHEYRMLAAGQCDYLMFNRLMPWDHAPGWLLHREAGGYSAQFDGSPYRPDTTGGGLICTSDRASWQALRTALLEV
jgi:fructose-1,6-bisphosphatase/inositol monophosphatase family enzyme